MVVAGGGHRIEGVITWTIDGKPIASDPGRPCASLGAPCTASTTSVRRMRSSYRRHSRGHGPGLLPGGQRGHEGRRRRAARRGQDDRGLAAARHDGRRTTADVASVVRIAGSRGPASPDLGGRPRAADVVARGVIDPPLPQEADGVLVGHELGDGLRGERDGLFRRWPGPSPGRRGCGEGRGPCSPGTSSRGRWRSPRAVGERPSALPRRGAARRRTRLRPADRGCRCRGDARGGDSRRRSAPGPPRRGRDSRSRP
jgi:hypothetical protein